LLLNFIIASALTITLAGAAEDTVSLHTYTRQINLPEANQISTAPAALVQLPFESLSTQTMAPALAAKETPRADFGVFQSVAISAASLPAASKWQDARQTDYSAMFGPACVDAGIKGCDSPFAEKIQALAQQVDGLSGAALLDRVNRTVNAAMTYKSDRAAWGVDDYWATPVEMAQQGAGDCEDFAIAKYWALRSLGLLDEQMQLVVLQDTRRQLFHAVLVVHTASGAYVLDNVSNRLLADTAYPQYQPIMSFAGSKNFIHGFASGSRNVAEIPRDLSAVMPGSGM